MSSIVSLTVCLFLTNILSSVVGQSPISTVNLINGLGFSNLQSGLGLGYPNGLGGGINTGLGTGIIGTGIGAANLASGLAGPGYANLPSGFVGQNVQYPGVGGVYGGVGNGDLKVAGELPVAGTTAIAGHVPVVGSVQFGGDIKAGGVVTISGTCGCGY